MKTSTLLINLLLIFAFILCQRVHANENKVVYQTTKISEHVYIFTRNWDTEGRHRNNIGVVIGDEGITLVNVMYESEIEELLREIKKFSNKPIQFVFNSNWDFHNTDANKILKNKGATLIAHENIKYFDNTVTQLTFKDKLTLDIGTDSIIAYRSYGHSMGHINIFFKKANVIFMSDSFRDQWMTTQGPYGYKGHIKGLRSAVALTNKQTKFVPGNTSSSIYLEKEALLKEIDIRDSFVSQVVTLQEQGMSVSEISQDKSINKLFKDNYERYPEYGRDLTGSVRGVQYSIRLEKNKGDIESMKEYVGTYELPNKKIVEVFTEEGHLFARSKGLFYYLLSPISKDTFEFGWHFPDREIKFLRNKKSKIKGITVNLPVDDVKFGQNISLKYLKKVDLIKRIY
jgi:glyoxylase-like metal-dependent hydrolase (beta-lactamase superfamily II)